MNMELNIAMPEVSAPSISSGAMLVELSISVWTARRGDKEAKRKLDALTGANDDVYNITKKLTGDDPLLDKIRKHAASTRTNIHYHYTLPWSDTGPRLLTTACYFDYTKRMTEAQEQHNKMAAEYIAGFDDTVERVIANSPPGTFRRSEFPTQFQLRQKFGFRVNYSPVPEQGDWRVDVNNEARSELAAQYADFYQRKTVEAMQDVWQRANKALTHVSERLADPEPGFTGVVTKEGRKKFSETLLEDMMEMVDLMKRCNITNDEKMRRAERRLSDALLGITTDAVKYDPHLRNSTKQEIDKVIADLPSLDMGC